MKKKANRGAETGSSNKGSCPVLLGIGSIGALIFAVAKKGDSFSLALGDAFIIEAMFFFGLAWVDYLKKDGIRIFPPKRTKPSDQPESWKDRVPGLDQEPPSSSPLPGPEGPGSAEYLGLAEAENRLRQRILYGDRATQENEDTGGSKMEGKPSRSDSVRSLFLCAAVLFFLGLFFEYLLPSLLVSRG